MINPTSKPTTDQELTARVEALENEVAALTERVTALEGEEPPVEPPPEIEPPEEITGDLSVEITLPGGTLHFSEADATDLGAYIGDFVRQHCRAQRQGAWTVFFRPDVDGRRDVGAGRDEVVVEYGAYDFSVSPTVPVGERAHILQPFTATIKSGTALLATIIVPKQYWLTRWRWQSAPRPIVRNHDDLVAMKAILPLSEAALWNNPPDTSSASAVWSGPMGTGGLMVAMGTTGDRQELGPITDLQGSYLVRGNEAALTGMLAQAEAVGSFPFWLRSDGDNLLDVFAHPYEGLQFTSNATKYPKLYPANPPNDANFFELDAAHHPAVAYIPWLLTDDPFFLEGAQMQAIYAACNANYHQINQELPGLASPSQKRSWGWGTRDILRMSVMAPENPPQWLRPRSYFRRMDNDNLTYVTRHMEDPQPACQIFHLCAGLDAVTSWEEGYTLSGFGWLRWNGSLPEWDIAVDWLAGTLLGLSDPAPDAWERRWPAPYRAYLYTSANWGELWANYQAEMTTPITIGPDDKIYENRTDNPATCPSGPHYHEVMLGALTALALGGVPQAQEHADWMRARMQPVYVSYNNQPSSFRYAYGATPV